MLTVMKFASLLLLSVVMTIELSAQCETWINSATQEEAENAHVVYRQYIKNKDFAGAFEQWKIAFDLAPAADGRRDSHFEDGISIYRDFLNNTSDDAKKQEYKDKILALYEQGAECIANGAITYKGCTEEACRNAKLGQWKGAQAVDMYYYIQVPRAESFEVFKEAIQLAGNQSNYTILKPSTDIIVYLYLQEKIDAETARQYLGRLEEIIEYNVANNEKYKQYYEYEQALMQPEVEKIEKMIYDCEYFVNKLRPLYEEDPENPDNLKYIVATLKQQDCPEGQPFLTKVESEYEEIAAAYNAARQAEFEANNPAVVAKKCYDEGDWNCAIEKYQEAIEKEEDPEQQASYYFSIASIQFRKLDQYNSARTTALKAAELKSGWGRPYMLIGDMYAKSSRNCGNGAYEHGLAVLAAIDKWSYAKSVDSSVASEANRNIARYSQYIPPQDDAFMMGKKEGDREKVSCWIGETVTLRFN